MSDGRYYEFDNDTRKYVSVTTFLSVINKPFLMPWAARMERELIRELIRKGEIDRWDWEKVLDTIKEYIEPKQPYGFQLYNEARAGHGNVVHKAIDYTLKKLKLPRMSKAEKKAYKKWLDWWDKQGWELIGAEQVVKSAEHGYAGTLDALVTRNSETVIIDWKTGKNHYAEHVLQNLAYQKAVQIDGHDITGGLLVYIPDDELLGHEKDIFTHPVPQVTPELMQPVLDALSLWRWSNNKPWKEK